MLWFWPWYATHTYQLSHDMYCLSIVTCYILFALYRLVPDICNLASHRMKYTGTLMGAYSDVKLGVSSFLSVLVEIARSVYWECAMKYTWGWTCVWIWEDTWEYTWKRTYIQLSGVELEVNWEVYMVGYFRVCLEGSWEPSSEHRVKHAVNVPIGSIVKSITGNVHERNSEL